VEDNLKRYNIAWTISLRRTASSRASTASPAGGVCTPTRRLYVPDATPETREPKGQWTPPNGGVPVLCGTYLDATTATLNCIAPH
jgi:hypothetical protein